MKLGSLDALSHSPILKAPSAFRNFSHGYMRQRMSGGEGRARHVAGGPACRRQGQQQGFLFSSLTSLLVLPSHRAPHLAVVHLVVADAGALAQPLAGRKLFFQHFGAEAEGTNLLIGEQWFCWWTRLGSYSADGAFFSQSIQSNIKYHVKLCQNIPCLPGVTIRSNQALERFCCLLHSMLQKTLLSRPATCLGHCSAASTAEVNPWA